MFVGSRVSLGGCCLPGLGLDIPIVVEAQRLGIPIINDIELFAQGWTHPSSE
ncbi:MAG: hypothetical protein CM1200mP36_11240 [Gammaproteobacteria bacterium]|nr:MAG: hypothetical protein CM1200mP36_11240 [Gammaproteobacteria bacterium]